MNLDWSWDRASPIKCSVNDIMQIIHLGLNRSCAHLVSLFLRNMLWSHKNKPKILGGRWETKWNRDEFSKSRLSQASLNWKLTKDIGVSLDESRTTQLNLVQMTDPQAHELNRWSWLFQVSRLKCFLCRKIYCTFIRLHIIYNITYT